MTTSFVSCKSAVLGVVLALGLGAAAQAQPRGPHPHWGWRYDPWVAPLIIGATVGTAVYLSRPYPPVTSTVVMMPPPMVVVSSPVAYTSTYTTTTVSAPMPVVEAYYCRESAQYYPSVQTCPSPWMLVRSAP